MVFWFRKEKVAAKTTTQAVVREHGSLMKNLGHRTMAWARRFARSDAFDWLLVTLMMALVAAYCYAAVQWWEERHPKQPLGILTGELLKDFDRYSPDDNHTETVLAEVVAAEVTSSVPCNASSCLWFSNLPRRDDPSLARPSACQDFYGHTCWGMEGVSLYKQAAQRLMELVADYAVSQMDSKDFDESRVKKDVAMLMKCVEGDTEAVAFAIDCAFGTRTPSTSEDCPAGYPNLPHKVTENLLDGSNVSTVEELFSQLERFNDKFNVTVLLELGNSDLRRAMQPERVDSLCSWLGESARCHLMQLFEASDDDIRRYQKLWNEFYFAPLFVGQKATALWDLLEAGESSRKLACVEIHEGLFRRESAKAATVVLDAKLTDAQEVTANLFQVAREALGIRVPRWLSRHEEGESPRLQEERRPGYLEELEAVQVELVALSGVTTTDYTLSIYSWEVDYDYDRNMLVVPQGLLAVMATATGSIEPITSVLVSAQMMLRLLPQPYSPYSWTEAHDEHMSYVTGCLRSVHNATLDFDAEPDLLTDLTYSSALLGPLYDVYRRGIIEDVSPAVYLNSGYSNWELFFVLWATSHCGDPGKSDMVNAVVRNSMRFGRVFECGLGDAMFSKRKCNFWVYW